jgi:molybdenum cofactor cytidylyltransferase
MKVAAILLAAGSSTRMGRTKQLLPYRDETLVRWTARTALDSGCTTVLAVLGAQSAMVRTELEDLPVQLLENPQWAEGMGSSVRCGVRGALALDPDLDATVLLLADQPQVTANTINRLVETATTTAKPIVASAYSNTLGVPALFTRDIFDELSNLPSEWGAKKLIAEGGDRVVAVPAPEAAWDIDTPENYRDLSEVNHAKAKFIRKIA